MSDVSLNINSIVPKEKKHKIDLPDYTLGEELISSISHGVGSALSIAGTFLCVSKAIKSGSTLEIVSAALFGVMMFLLYTMSCIYHGLARNNAKRVFRVFDHCTIFLLIAGTYFPIVLLSVGGTIGWIYFSIIVVSSIIGIVFNAIDVDKYQKVSLFCYVFMGWIIVFAFKPLYESIGKEGIKLLVIGGVIYTVGAVVYQIGDNKKYFHSIWHFFVLGGTILHFFAIYLYVL